MESDGGHRDINSRRSRVVVRARGQFVCEWEIHKNIARSAYISVLTAYRAALPYNMPYHLSRVLLDLSLFTHTVQDRQPAVLVWTASACHKGTRCSMARC